MSDKHPLPRSVQEIADVIGRDAALSLIKNLPRCYVRDFRYPGAKSRRVILYVPKVLRADHQLVTLLGWHAAEKLAHAFGGEMLNPAVCFGIDRAERDDAIRALYASRTSIQDIAREFRISDRHVRNIVKENPHVEANDNSSKSAAA